MESTGNPTRTVTRTYRAAIRLGEDFMTLEESITLPVDASDSDVQQAVELGWRIYQAQRESFEQQIATIRETHHTPGPMTVRDPDAPASDKQRNYIATLQDQLTWTNEQLAAHAADQAVDLVTMTKGQASLFIDGLKKLADERGRYIAESRVRMVNGVSASSSSDPDQPASERQLKALAKVAASRSLKLDEELQRRFDVSTTEVTSEQAAILLNEWQAKR
ncbi:hypothetical protein EYB53_002825 [Candidatus Chloroploca sp. M-50]|uniref:Uncharacterized protein n=1 Tax=Candidatus Chloroploca mongolica TaxID=2528176 RepID=A0ABS4D5B5_9CHLR|nr:hypothetical protein [Candidatus Chloroploca mongolica]MBP1464635.1 hypothetical protein [Candidatus Chloroploca mongolica]